MQADSEKIKEIRYYNRLTQQSLADLLGVTKSYVGSIENGKSKISKNTIQKISSLYKEGKLSKKQEEDYIDIPVRGEVKASMGYGITVYNDEQTATYSISKQLAFDLGVNPNYTEMILASGDSMEPDIKGGDSLLVDLSKKDIYDGRIYCVRIEGQLYAKRLQKIPPHTIKVVSDNKEKYDPFYIDFSKKLDYDFEVIGEVRWAGRVFK